MVVGITSKFHLQIALILRVLLPLKGGCFIRMQRHTTGHKHGYLNIHIACYLGIFVAMGSSSPKRRCGRKICSAMARQRMNGFTSLVSMIAKNSRSTSMGSLQQSGIGPVSLAQATHRLKLERSIPSIGPVCLMRSVSGIAHVPTKRSG